MKITYDKRLYIENALKNGDTVTKICKHLGITRSAFYYEIHRSGMSKENYSANIAQIERGMG